MSKLPKPVVTESIIDFGVKGDLLAIDRKKTGVTTPRRLPDIARVSSGRPWWRAAR